jgi:hypothetical protein
MFIVPFNVVRIYVLTVIVNHVDILLYIPIIIHFIVPVVILLLLLFLFPLTSLFLFYSYFYCYCYCYCLSHCRVKGAVDKIS